MSNPEDHLGRLLVIARQQLDVHGLERHEAGLRCDIVSLKFQYAYVGQGKQVRLPNVALLEPCGLDTQL